MKTRAFVLTRRFWLGLLGAGVALAAVLIILALGSEPAQPAPANTDSLVPTSDGLSPIPFVNGLSLDNRA